MRFQNIDERGEIARGTVRMTGDEELVLDWNTIGPNGGTARYRVRLELQGKDAYVFNLAEVQAGGELRELVSVPFRRVEQLPEHFTREKR